MLHGSVLSGGTQFLGGRCAADWDRLVYELCMSLYYRSCSTAGQAHRSYQLRLEPVDGLPVEGGLLCYVAPYSFAS